MITTKTLKVNMFSLIKKNTCLGWITNVLIDINNISFMCFKPQKYNLVIHILLICIFFWVNCHSWFMGKYIYIYILVMGKYLVIYSNFNDT